MSEGDTVGRPKQHGKRVSTAIRFKPDTHARLAEEAEARDLSVNWLVNRAVEEFLEHLIPVDEIMLTRRERDEPHSG